jgi:imidazolonepropionase-like amidohydrolase/Tol biopolymer transport system component
MAFCYEKAAYVDGETLHPADDAAASGFHQMSLGNRKRISFTTSEGTYMNVDVSPDGSTVAFDLLGDIYLLPIQGGTSASLTSGSAWDQAPLFSPDGAEIYFISDRHGAKNIWRTSIHNRTLRQITASMSDVVGPLNWTNDRRQIIAGLGDVDLSNAEVSLHAIDPHSGTMTELQRKNGPWLDLSTFQRLRERIRTFSGAQTSDGTVYYSEASFLNDLDRFVVRLYTLGQNAAAGRPVGTPNASYNEYAPQTSNDGTVLVWFREHPDRPTEIRIRDLENHRERVVVTLDGSDDAAYGASHAERPRYAFTPDGQFLVYWHAGKIWRADVEHGSVVSIPFELAVEREVQVRATAVSPDPVSDRLAKIIRWPTVSTDGRWLTFSAFGYIWIKDLESHIARRLTCSKDFEHMPAISPDGRSVAYVAFSADHPDYFSARLMIADRADGTGIELLAGENAAYLLPRWSQNGEMIGLIRETQIEGSIEAKFGWSSSTTGAFVTVADAPPSSSRTSLSLAARYVGFNVSADRLVFSYPESRDSIVLASADLAGTQPHIHAISHQALGGITPGPDMRKLLITDQNSDLWLLPLKTSPSAVDISLTDPFIRPISREGGYYAAWTTPERITYSIGRQVIQHDLDEATQFQTVEVSLDDGDPSETVVLLGGRVITMSGSSGVGRVVDSGAVVIRGRHIVDVAPIDSVEIPRDAAVINTEGMTIMPGLVEAHYHRIGGSAGAIGLSAFKLPNSSMDDPSAIRYGIMTAWEPGGIVDDGAPATADLHRAGRILGPRWAHSASGSVGYPWNQLTTYSDARRAVAMQKQLGATVLKEYTTPYRQQRQWLSAAVRSAGLRVYSHLQSFDGAMTSIVDGYSGGEHSYLPVPYFRDVEEMMRQTGYVWTPNVVISTGSVSSADILSRIQNPADHNNREHQGSKERRLPVRRASRVAAQAASASKLGISIGVSGHSMPGAGLHAEMWHLWKGGMPIPDVLRATTIGNAAKLGLDQYIGSLEPGKIADILVLERDPSVNIEDMQAIRFTIQSGSIFDAVKTAPVIRTANATYSNSCTTSQ